MRRPETTLTHTGTITSLLVEARQGEKSAMDRIFEMTYAQLRELARAQLASIKHGEHLEATGLVSAACERLLDGGDLDAENRRHFYYLLGRAMHDVVIDELRRADALKRGGGYKQVPLLAVEADGVTSIYDAMDLHDAIEELRASDADAAQVVILRYFGNRSVAQVAEMMGCTLSAARNNWIYAKAWLHERLSRGRDGRN